MTNKVAEAPEMPPPSVNIYFNKELKAPKNFKNLNIGEKVIAEIKGKTISLSQREDSQSFEMEIETVELRTGEIKSLKDAREAAIAKVSK